MKEANDGGGIAARSTEPNASGVTASRKRHGGSQPPGVLYLSFGVVFPLLVIGIEISTGMCAVEFFDPIPTILHVIFATLVPLVNLAVWLVVRRGLTWNARLLGMANGFAIGVAAYYTALFLPLLPLALIGIMFLIGFLPMAPLFALVVALRGRMHLRHFLKKKGESGVPGLIPGLALFLLVMVCINAQSTLTRVGLQMAASEQHAQSVKGIRLLRAFGDEELLTRACYRRIGLATDLISVFVSAGNPVPPRKVREIYYRVTGEAFDSVPPPHGVTRRSAFAPYGEFDAGLGGDTAAGRVRGLSLMSSRIDGSVDPDAALAYVEWTLEFRNDSILQREARAQIQLPAGATVSRLTLWIDGEEREAAFARRAKVVKAYKKIVRKKRDPVLVTTQGSDRILLQCFPVPSHGGTMKTRIGITAPLTLVSHGEGFLRLPRFLERNFSIEESCAHDLWLESRREMQSVGGTLAVSTTPSQAHALRGALSDDQLAGMSGVLRVPRPEAPVKAWTSDKAGKSDAVILQTIATRKTDPPQRIILLVDGSAPMRPYVKEIIQAVAGIPDGIGCSVLVASDKVVRVAGNVNSGDPGFGKEIDKRLKEIGFVGGCDNVPALETAWKMAARNPHSAIVWIHGPQPILMKSPSALVQNSERRPEGTVLFELAAGTAPNRIVEKLGALPSIRSVPRFGNLTDDLVRLFSQWKSESGEIILQRQRITSESPEKDLQGASQTSSHLARLWANDRIRELISSKAPHRADAATELAVRYKIVTPISGAVVLENTAQYTGTGLTPPSADGVPTIPEPEVYCLVVVALAGLAWLIYFRRQRWQTV